MSTSPSPTEEKAGLPRFIAGGDGNEPVSYPARRGEREPVHPGAIVARALTEMQPPMSVRAAAAEIGVTAAALGNVCNTTAAISPDMALRIGKFFGNGAGIWLRMQSAYDLWHAEIRLKEQLDAITPAAELPEKPRKTKVS